MQNCNEVGQMQLFKKLKILWWHLSSRIDTAEATHILRTGVLQPSYCEWRLLCIQT